MSHFIFITNPVSCVLFSLLLLRRENLRDDRVHPRLWSQGWSDHSWNPALPGDRDHVCFFLSIVHSLCTSDLWDFSTWFINPQVHGSPFNQDRLRYNYIQRTFFFKWPCSTKIRKRFSTLQRAISTIAGVPHFWVTLGLGMKLTPLPESV